MDARTPRSNSAAAVRPPSVSRVLGLSMLAVFATTLFVRAVDPIIPRIATSFAMDPHTVALLATAFSLPYAIMQPVLGGFAQDFSVLLVSRVVSGIVAGGVFPISVAIAADLVTVEKRQVAVGRMLGAAMIGNVLGSPGAGMAADPSSWRGVFAGMGVLSAIATV